MKHYPALPPLDWVKRVNRLWIVRDHLEDHAESWLEHLATLDDGRLTPSCNAARAMCEMRGPLDEPKPWFYAGLFHLATVPEARCFLATHRTTKATVLSMADDEDVRLWIDRVGPETRELLARLRRAISRIHSASSSNERVD